jgi:uncharacterized protein (TIGR02145 family)
MKFVFKKLTQFMKAIFINMHAKKLLSIFLILTLAAPAFWGCRKDEPVKTKKTLSALKSYVYPMEITILEAENIKFNKTSYSAKIGDTDIELILHEEYLAFLMPAISDGSHKIIATIEGRKYEVPITVKSTHTVADPASFVQSQINDFTFSNAELDEIHAAMKNKPGMEDSENEIKMLKSYNEELSKIIAEATPEELSELANFIQVNKELFTNRQNPVSFIDDSLSFNKMSNVPEFRYREIVSTILDRGSKVIISGCGMALFILNPEPIVTKALGTVAAIALVYNLYEMKSELMAISNAAVMPNGNFDVWTVSQNKTYTFVKDKSYDIAMKQDYRNLNKNDVSSSAPGIKSIVKVMDGVDKYWNALREKLGGMMGVNKAHLKLINVTNIKSLLVHAEHLEIKNISNNKVTGKVTKKDEKLYVTFTTKETANQNFTFDVIYKFETGTFTKKVEAVLQPIAKGCDPLKTVTDIDGNVYNVITIGNQCWMRENLRTSRYSNGNSIQKLNTTWIATTSGVWVNYADNPAFNSTYGKLYNGIAASSSHKICPTGWKLPTNSDINELKEFLGGQNVAGGKLKALDTWKSPNTGATNESGFTALAGGYAMSGHSVLNFLGGPETSYWWMEASLVFIMEYNSAELSQGFTLSHEKWGHYIRCIKE